MDHPDDLSDLRAGIHWHYKGPPYQAFGFAHDANYEGRIGVFYMGLKLDGAHLGPRMAFRTFEAKGDYADHDAWTDLVCTVHGCKMERCEHLVDTHPGGLEAVQAEHASTPDHNLIVPRFEYGGPQWYGEQRNPRR